MLFFSELAKCPQESLNSFKFIIYSVKIGMKTSSKPILENHKIVWKALLALPDNVVESLLSPSCDPNEIVLQLEENLPVDQTDLKEPSPETKKMIRCLAAKAKDLCRIDVVKHLREFTPAGTTGEFASIIWLSVDSFIHQFVPRTMKPDCYVHYDCTAT